NQDERYSTRALPRSQVITAGRIAFPGLHEVDHHRGVLAIGDREAVPDRCDWALALAERIKGTEPRELTMVGIARRHLWRDPAIEPDVELIHPVDILDLHAHRRPEPARGWGILPCRFAAAGRDERGQHKPAIGKPAALPDSHT